MRTNVAFRYPVDFVYVSDDDGVLSVSSAEWFVNLLRRIPAVKVNADLCQEAWGVAAFAERNQKRFGIGSEISTKLTRTLRHHLRVPSSQRYGRGSQYSPPFR